MVTIQSNHSFPYKCLYQAYKFDLFSPTCVSSLVEPFSFFLEFCHKAGNFEELIVFHGKKIEFIEGSIVFCRVARETFPETPEVMSHVYQLWRHIYTTNDVTAFPETFPTQLFWPSARYHLPFLPCNLAHCILTFEWSWVILHGEQNFEKMMTGAIYSLVERLPP